jgi:hypothetical protein
LSNCGGILEPLGTRGRFGKGPLGGGRGGGNTEFRNALKETGIDVVAGPTTSCDKARGGAVVYIGLRAVVVLPDTSSNTVDCCTG